MKSRLKFIIIITLFCFIINVTPADAAYHKHVDGTGTMRSDTIYSTTNPGGCYRAAGHTHDRTGACPTTKYTAYLKDYHDYGDGCSWHDYSNEFVYRYECGGCGQIWRYGNASGDYSKVDPPVHYHYGCGNPTNTWTPNCGITQAWGYTIRYYKNNVLTETTTSTSSTKSFTAPLKSYANYKTPTQQTVSLADDDSTVINYYYELNQYTITTTIDGGYGALSQSQKVDYNQNSSVYYYPANGYNIDYIKINGTKIESKESSYVFTNVTANKTVNIKFKITDTRKSEIVNATYNWIDLKIN